MTGLSQDQSICGRQKAYMDCTSMTCFRYHCRDATQHDNKDALPKCIRTFKKLIAKDWHSMTDMPTPKLSLDPYMTWHVYTYASMSPRVESTSWSLTKNHPVARSLLENCWRKDAEARRA